MQQRKRNNVQIDNMSSFFPTQLLFFPFCIIISSQMPFPFISSFFIFLILL